MSERKVAATPIDRALTPEWCVPRLASRLGEQMASPIQIVRTSLGSGFYVVADLTEDWSRVEWTLRSPNDDRIRVRLSSTDVQVLLQVRDDSGKKA